LISPCGNRKNETLCFQRFAVSADDLAPENPVFARLFFAVAANEILDFPQIAAIKTKNRSLGANPPISADRRV